MTLSSAKASAECLRGSFSLQSTSPFLRSAAGRLYTAQSRRQLTLGHRRDDGGGWLAEHTPLPRFTNPNTPSSSGAQKWSARRPRNPRRTFATVSSNTAVASHDSRAEPAAPKAGPLMEYNRRVEQGTLRDDPYQREIISKLQTLYEELKTYRPPRVVHPSIESLDQKRKAGFLSSLFGRGSSQASTPTGVPSDLPKGLYMYGDVGCGKTMLMDLFYETLPPNISSKTRIHFHNFMQDVHKRMHAAKMKYGTEFDALPLVAADIAETASVLCFDEFQCTDVADAMILRRLLEFIMSHGVIVVTTSNRHPDDLYKNGIQRQSFIPAINLLKTALTVINLDSSTDYRKIPRPSSGVYFHPLGPEADDHADKWFEFLGDPANDPPHPARQVVWGRAIHVPAASGKAARFTFKQLLGSATGAADYLELVRHYDAFIVTDVPGMTFQQRDLARRFITFIDAVYESRAKLVLTCAVPLTNMFMSESEIKSSLAESGSAVEEDDHSDVSDAMRHLMDDLGLSMQALKSTSIFSGDEERFAFARALSRLVEMGSKEWVEKGLGVGMTAADGKYDHSKWMKLRSHWMANNM